MLAVDRTKPRYSILGLLLALVTTVCVFSPSQPARAQEVEADLTVRGRVDTFPDLGIIVFGGGGINRGPDTAVDAFVIDTLILPPGARILDIGSGCERFANVVTCRLGDIPSGEPSFIFSKATICVPEGGTVTDIVTVASATPDPDPSNNTGTLTESLPTPTNPGCEAPRPEQPGGGGGGDNGGDRGDGRGGGGVEITQDSEQEAESGEVDQTFDVS
jgi:hypothetical protein